MIFQSDYRFIPIFTSQLFIIVIFLILALKILKRNVNRANVTLSLYYFFTSSGLIFNILFFILPLIDPWNIFLATIFYDFTYYLLFLSLIFLLAFTLNLLMLESEFTKIKYLVLVFTHAIITFMFLFFPEGITIIKVNNEWRPLYSWLFLITMYIYFSGVIVIPTIIYSLRLYKRFEAKNLKKRLRYFILGVIGSFIVLYGVGLYNTWHDPIFRLVWGILNILILIPSGLLIYYGIGQNL